MDAFIPGLGIIIGSMATGKVMTRDYKLAEAGYREANNLPPTHRDPAQDFPANYPREYARLRPLVPTVGMFVLSTTLYGFSFGDTTLTSLPGWIAVPLVMQFLNAASTNALLALYEALVSDLCPGKGASCAAINNLVRYGLGAVGVAFVETMVAYINPEFGFLSLAMIVVGLWTFAEMKWKCGQA